jgi:hypothetical protein
MERMDMTLWTRGLVAVAIALAGVGPNASAAPGKTLSTIDLSKPFGTRSRWRFTATQGADVRGLYDEPEPGPISLCISKDDGRSCQPAMNDMLTFKGEADSFSEPHVLDDVTLVHPNTTTTLLLVRVASLAGMNGDRRSGTRLLAYDRGRDSFVRVYTQVIGQNNNQEVRYIADGGLRGAVISPEPTDDAPFGFWVTVSRFLSAGRYEQVLRYRSATLYNGGNPLAVIDSEMPNIQQRLGLWRPGLPIPLPKKGCARPHIVRGALWC